MSGMSVEEIKRVVAQRVANAIEAIAIYKTKTNMPRKSMSQTERQEDKVAENANNKRKWEGNHNGSSSQQNKGHKVMAISVISVSSDSSEDSVGTPAGRVILFGTIPTTIPDTTPVITPPTTQTDTTVIPTEIPIIAPTIPPSPDYTPASPDYSPASDMEFDPSEDPSSDHIPPLPAISPFLSSADDTTDSDTPDTPPSPTHGTPFTETTLSTQRSPTASGALRRRVMVLAPGQPIPHGRPYCYHLNGPVHMMTARKRVGPLPTHRLVVRHSVDYSSFGSFSLDDSIIEFISSETSSDSPTDALSDSASSRSSPYHSLPTSPSGMTSSHRLCSLSRVFIVHLLFLRDHLMILLLVSLLEGSPKTATNLEDCSEDRFEPYVPREVGLGVDFEDESSEPSRSRGADLVMDVDVVRSDGIEIDPEIQAEIDECFAYADALRDRGIDARVVVEAVDREESETVEVTYETLGDLVQRFHDHTEAIPVHCIQAIEGVQEKTLRGTMSVKNQRVDRIQRSMSLAKEIEAREVTMNLEPLNENRDEQDSGNGGNGGNGNGGNGGNGNGGNGGNENGGNGENKNGNRNRIHGMNY
ncbi:hypothetical protein Tco_0730532 [Tanacetum coccineum]|uniref:Band 7 domain-containing protein n=1 Tax=Tanacetum coccineum TaxID=301880 RepID=A0ABQ4YT84_9ASTR